MYIFLLISIILYYFYSLSFFLFFYLSYLSLSCSLIGEVYLFENSTPWKEKDWKSDGHKWENSGTSKLPKSCAKVSKTYFYIKDEHNNVNNKFRKDVYTLLHKSNSNSVKYLINYIGDDSLSVPTAYGNAKTQDSNIL